MIQVLQVRFEADSPDDAVEIAATAILEPGLEVTWIREEHDARPNHTR